MTDGRGFQGPAKLLSVSQPLPKRMELSRAGRSDSHTGAPVGSAVCCPPLALACHRPHFTDEETEAQDDSLR